MTSHPHRLDLARAGCSYLDVFFSLPESHPSIMPITACLQDGTAAAAYRRSNIQHTALFSHHTTSDGTSDYRLSWFALDPEIPKLLPQGDPWTALELAYAAADLVHMHCMFNPTASREPRMTLPISLFASGAFPFNQIQGYRAALTDGDRTVWTAIVDRLGAPEGFQIQINFPEYTLPSVPSSRDLLGACTSVYESLMVAQDNG